MLRIAVLVLVASVAHCMTNLVDDLGANQNTTQLSSLIAQAGLGDTLKGQGPFTILAPVDSAFAAIPKDDLNKLLADKNDLANTLKYHVLQGEIFSWDIVTGRLVHSITGHAIRVYKQGNDIYFNNAKAVAVDLESANGVIYLLDTVLDVPEGTIYEILEKPEYKLTQFKKAVDRVRYDRMLNSTYSSANYRHTLFVPSDAAFAKLDQSQVSRIFSNLNFASELVRYHLHLGTLHLKSLDHNGRITTLYTGHDIGVDISNNDIRLNHVAHMTESDIEADNGVVHIIDHVLIPSTLSGQIIG
ncbi:transforming growth factor-beta-induced protein ig-h3-like [Haliotis rufescens]|uniref:transforming growth factor-beta-induced protein ig-h3-like n=1 Tax=Haliotis rufescens TaxID=6454 RepID=UPI001EB08994|nr:transforming growth factor-beta-induced protein ig-h3-like [Haliotis rufescens]